VTAHLQTVWSAAVTVHLQTAWSAERNRIARREQNNACQTTEIFFSPPRMPLLIA
jgi:hypothetical protein